MSVAVQRAGSVAIVEIERPETRNALDPETMERLAGALETCDGDRAFRSVVVTGRGGRFASGADLKWLRDRSAREALDLPSERFWSRLRAIRTPLVAAVEGHALGAGLELVLCCDMAVSAADARFGAPEVSLGLIPGGGATQRLTRAVGKGRAMRMVLTGVPIDAATAHAWGLVAEVVAPGSARRRAIELAEEVARNAPLAVRFAKQAVDAAAELPLTAGLAMERRLYELAMSTDDRSEGLSAFLERRAPSFGDR